MSGYIIEEPNDEPIYFNNDDTLNYTKLYSPLQDKRHKKVMYQLKETWYAVFNTIKFMRNMSNMSLEESNDLMLKVHKMFFIEFKNKIEFYNEEKMIKRRQKGYLSKKIDKLKKAKAKL